MAKFRGAWQNRDKLGDRHRDREMAQFLPAALEIQATPPHPLARWLTWCLVVLVLLTIIWALLGKINIVASAEGKIIPSSRVKHIQPLEKAVVKTILVKEGQYVHQGDALVELDNTLTHADQSRLTAELEILRHNLAITQILLDLLAKPVEEQQQVSYAQLPLPDNQNNIFYKQLLWQQWQQYWSQTQTLYHSLKRIQAQQAGSHEQVKKLEQTLPIITRRADRMKGLLQNNFVSEDDYLTLEQERIEQAQNLKSEQQNLKQLQASEKETEQQLQSLNAQVQAQHLVQMTEYQRQITVLDKELIKAKDLNFKQVLYAPTSGRVQELAISTVGGVVTGAQKLMLIVPDEEQLEVKAFLENKDIGFVKEGMAAEIKVHTFPFTKYGIIDAEVITVSDDATLDEKRGLIYGMHLLMKQSTVNVNGKAIKLTPGMAITAEMKTGHRRIIEFFLAPLLRYKHEGLRER